jgi:hypothetical protein
MTQTGQFTVQCGWKDKDMNTGRSRRCVLALLVAVVAIGLLATSSDARVLCEHKKNGHVMVRESACKRKEQVLDVSEFLQTPAVTGDIQGQSGVEGPMGPPGAQGPAGPAGPPGAAGSVAGAADVAVIEARVVALENLLAAVSLHDDGAVIRFSGVNLQVVSGAGTTDGTPNGRGNVIVGYNERRNDETDDRSGSHNLILGRENTFSSFAGIVGGQGNTATSWYASVLGGFDNTAAGAWSVVSGGQENRAASPVSTVGGGTGNTARAISSAVCGGDGNIASGFGATVCGGAANAAAGLFSSVSGGQHNRSDGTAASVSGGGGEFASDGNRASGDHSVVSGGASNHAGGDASVIGGGSDRAVEGPEDWRAGDLFQGD